MIIAIVTSMSLVFAAVVIHLVMLEALTALLPRMEYLSHFRMGVLILISIVVHLIEITVFAAGFFFLAWLDEEGGLNGAELLHFGDYIYYSAVTYSTLGYGDITPQGSLCILAAVESLTGIVLITWTASYMFLAMQRFWHTDQVELDDTPTPKQDG